MSKVIVEGSFDNIGARDLRFLEEAAKFGGVTVLLWPDSVARAKTGKEPRFPYAERCYFLRATRYVAAVLEWLDDDAALPPDATLWVERKTFADSAREHFCRERGLDYRLIAPRDLNGFPVGAPMPSGGKKVVVTGCYDWFHSGHVRFFEEAAAFGDLYVVVGNDANIRQLKGEGHPLIAQDERRYIVGSIKYVTQAQIATGEGWLDADPQIRILKPDYYVVNEDGDKGGKREYCEANGIAYTVLKREPAPGMPRRSSTDLRGF